MPFIFPNFKFLSITFFTFIFLILVYFATEIFFVVKKTELTTNPNLMTLSLVNYPTAMNAYVWDCVLYYSGAGFTYSISKKG